MNKKLTKEEQAFEDMRMQVRDLEMKARYWEAQWKIKHYTLEAEKLSEPYGKYLEAEMAAREKAFEEFKKSLEQIQQDPNMVVSDENGELPITEEVENGSR